MTNVKVKGQIMNFLLNAFERNIFELCRQIGYMTVLAMFHVTGKMSICNSVPQGDPGTLIFSSCVGSDSASTVHSKKYQDFKHTKKI